MKKNIGISLLVFALLGLIWGVFWGPLVPSKDRIITAIQQRIVTEQKKGEVREFVSCVNKNPNVTAVAVGFYPNTSSVAPHDRELLVSVSYAIHAALPEDAKAVAFGEAHRVIFVCALNLKTYWDKISIYYLDFTPVYVLDDAKPHVLASVTMSITTKRAFTERVVKEKEISSILITSVGYANELPEPDVILTELSTLNLTLASKAANGDVALALKRYSAITNK